MEEEVPAARVTLGFSCRGLPKLDWRSKSDPMVVVLGSRPHLGQDFAEIGRTEMVQDCHEPDFTTRVQLDYFFEETQPLKLTVVDVDDPKSVKLGDQDIVGVFETRLSAVFTAPGQELTGPLTHKGKTTGSITIRGEELVDLKQTLHLHLAADHLDSKDGFFGRSDPFLKIFRARMSGSWEAVYSTEVIKQDLSPVWKPFSVSLAQLCNGDVDRPLRIECHDWDKDGSTDFIGCVQVTARMLSGNTNSFALVNERKKKNQGVAGTLKVLSASVTREVSFLDYVAGGCELSLITAIDFTASNGAPKDPKSLHHVNPAGGHTAYEQAIMAIGSIVVPYDTDRIVPTFGFGAKMGGNVSHCFPLAESGCAGVEGILSAYRECLESVKLWGPTICSEVIALAAQQAQQSKQQGSNKYTILLILTDGEITDMDDTVNRIVEASSLPLSIIIVGIGNENFSDMKRLDADDGFLKGSVGQAVRDIVQFVPFREFRDKPFAALAKHTLGEVPGQFVSYMKSQNIAPNPPRPPVPQQAP